MDKNRIKIALVNSQLFVRDSISRMLVADARFDVCINAANGNELIKSLSGIDILPDICLLDVQMPGMNGYETMNCISQNWPGIKVVVHSQLEDEFVINNMLKLGVRSYLGKDCSIGELYTAIVNVYENGHYSSVLMNNIASGTMDKALCIDEQEYTYLKYCHTEMTAREIAGKMNVSQATIKTCRDSLFGKLKVRTRQGLAIFAYKTGIIAPGDIQPCHRGQYHFSSV